MEKAFYFTLKVLFVLEIFTLLDFLYYVEKRLDKKAIVNFEIYDVTDWTKKQLQSTYCPILQEVKAIRQ